MAGTGSHLRKLTQPDIFEGNLGAAFAASGPWIVTILCLSVSSLIPNHLLDFPTVSRFRLIMIYNFCFSLVFCGPLLLVLNRCPGDKTSVMKRKGSFNTFLGSLLTILLTQAPIAGLFYWLVADTEPLIKLAAFVNYFAVCTLWPATVFLSTVKTYREITRTFLAGLTVSLGLTLPAAYAGTTTGMLMGFSLGLLIVVFTAIAHILAEYSGQRGYPFAFFACFWEHRDLAFGGLVFYAAIWADKWVMWFVPEREEIVPGLPSYPDYDSAMFFALLTVIPTLAGFLMHLETGFKEKYLRFYRVVRGHAHYDTIQENLQEVISSLKEGSRTILLLQGTVTLAALIIAPKVFGVFNLNPTQVSMFRFGALGAAFHAMTAVMLIVLHFFDYRRIALYLACTFLVLNTGFSIISMKMGFAYYGAGYFVSALLTCAITVGAVLRCIDQALYQIFVGNNKSGNFSKSSGRVMEKCRPLNQPGGRGGGNFSAGF
ncbi:MAG: exopolysaccharide Pel transporter PelG [Acidobacteriota bacterium]|nr:exopolysaccharide Pel transporter PelG [Acidobacteriota bacterium]